MKKILIALLVLVLAVFFFWKLVIWYVATQNVVDSGEPVTIPGVEPNSKQALPESSEALPAVAVRAGNLTIPWDIVFLDNGELLITERSGNVVVLDTNNGQATEIEVPNVSHRGEGGLLGMVAHPQFSENKYVYVYRTSTLGEGSNASINQVIRYEYENEAFWEETIIVDNIPGSLFHNGGRIAFGPDGYLYITTGDARVPESAQDLNSLAGKILRVTDEGTIPPGNPFDTMVYSYGHRNPQGLTWDDEGRLWSTEHGRTTAALTGMDELNLIEAGGNYGWPESEGDTVLSETIGPKIHSGPNETWAPGGATYVNGRIFFGGLRGETLYEARVEGSDVTELTEHFAHEYGRIRTTLIGPDGGLYFMTSNRDGRGDVTPDDDRIVRINIDLLDK